MSAANMKETIEFSVKSSLFLNFLVSKQSSDYDALKGLKVDIYKK